MNEKRQSRDVFKEANINGVASDFCQYADRYYIAARTLYKNECYDQFLYVARQSLELYLKSIHIFHRIELQKIKQKAGDTSHTLKPLYQACKEYIPTFDMVPQRVSAFLCGDISEYNAIRYPDVPLVGKFEWIEELDHAVWVLRFFTHPKTDVTYFDRVHSIGFERLLNGYTRDNRGHGNIAGYLERVLKNKAKHPKERENLVWRNLYFGKKKTRQIRIKRGFWSKNNTLFGGPVKWQKSVYEDTKTYVKYPKRVELYFASLS
jgi:hypothetical protein